MPLDDTELVRLDGIRQRFVKWARNHEGHTQGGISVESFMDDIGFLLTVIGEMEFKEKLDI